MTKSLMTWSTTSSDLLWTTSKTELVVMGIKVAITQYQLPIDPDEVACFDEFHERFGKYISAASN